MLKQFLLTIMILTCAGVSFAHSKEKAAQMKIYDIEVKDISGKTKKLSEYKDKTLLIVNTASACGYTPQYKGLETIYEKYKNKGLVVLGFPSNDFGAQEPGTEKEIKEFCELKFKVSFPMFSKVEVKGDGAHPLYKELQKQTGSQVAWNFGKFLVSGDSISYFPSKVEPESPELISAIEKTLK